MDKRKILASEVPYIALFGVDGMGKGRPANGTPAADLIPRLEPPLGVDAEVAYRIRNEAKTRALTVLKTIFGREFKLIYEKEVRHLVQVQKSDEADQAAEGDGRSGQE
jgi:hypothetical protein